VEKGVIFEAGNIYFQGSGGLGGLWLLYELKSAQGGIRIRVQEVAGTE
jgi:hypothetical protein